MLDGVITSYSIHYTKLYEDELRNGLNNTDRVAKRSDKSVYLLEELKIPAVLVEVGFLSNPEEARLLGDEKYQQKVAASIYQGIMKYISKKESGSKADNSRK